MSPLRSWLNVPKESPFSLRCLPFGIISTVTDPTRRVAVAIGNHAIDLKAFSLGGGFAGLPEMQGHTDVFSEDALNRFAELGQARHRAVRQYLQTVLRADNDNTAHAALLKNNASLRAKAVVALDSVSMHLPMRIGDYTDFYAGIRHASTVGTILRGADKALQPNYKHIPVAYHGRASSIVVSGTPLRRPRGQILPPGSSSPVFTTCKRLDIELEMAALVCRDSELGVPVDVNAAAEYVFGYVLMNDWSARDIQAWEYVPLGPFTAKNFGTTISPWVVLADALEPFRTTSLPNDTQLQDYLKENRKDSVFDIKLRVELQSKLQKSCHQRITGNKDTHTNPCFLANSPVWRQSRLVQLQRVQPDLVVSANDCPPHHHGLQPKGRRSARLWHHQRPRQRQSGLTVGGQ